MESKGDDVLVNDGRNKKYDQRGNKSITTTKQFVNVLIDVGIKPVMNNDVPRAAKNIIIILVNINNYNTII
jgi:hypothetical protein